MRINARSSSDGAFPRLDGQRLGYLAGSLMAYARGQRHSGIMEPVAANLGMDDIRGIAEYYAGLPAGGPVNPAADAQAIVR